MAWYGHGAYMITSSQCRAARALLDWSQQDLAAKAGVGLVTIHQLEAGRISRGEQPWTSSSVPSSRRALISSMRMGVPRASAFGADPTDKPVFGLQFDK